MMVVSPSSRLAWWLLLESMRAAAGVVAFAAPAAEPAAVAFRAAVSRWASAGTLRSLAPECYKQVR